MEPVLRAAAVYVFLMVVVRAAGRRTLGEMTTFDFVLLLVISEAAQNAMVGNDFSLTNGFLVILTLVGLDEAFRRGQAETGPARLCREERREDLFSDLGRNAGAAIDERDLTRRIEALDRDADRALTLHRVCPIDQDILKRDPQHVRVRLHRWGDAVHAHIHVTHRGILA